jgi:hypothetical protein
MELYRHINNPSPGKKLTDQEAAASLTETMKLQRLLMVLVDCAVLAGWPVSPMPPARSSAVS